MDKLNSTLFRIFVFSWAGYLCVRTVDILLSPACYRSWPCVFVCSLILFAQWVFICRWSSHLRNECVQQALGRSWDSFLALAKVCWPSMAPLVSARKLLVAAEQCVLCVSFSLLVCCAVSCFPREAVDAVAKLCDIGGSHFSGEKVAPELDPRFAAARLVESYPGSVPYDRFHAVHQWQDAITKIVVVGLTGIFLSLLFQASIVVFCRRRFFSEILLSTDHSRVLELLKALTALELCLQNFDAADIYSKLALNLAEDGRLPGFVELVRARLFVLNGLPGAGLNIHRLVSLIVLFVLYTLTLVAYAI